MIRQLIPLLQCDTIMYSHEVCHQMILYTYYVEAMG